MATSAEMIWGIEMNEVQEFYLALILKLKNSSVDEGMGSIFPHLEMMACKMYHHKAIALSV